MGDFTIVQAGMYTPARNERFSMSEYNKDRGVVYSVDGYAPGAIQTKAELLGEAYLISVRGLNLKDFVPHTNIVDREKAFKKTKRLALDIARQNIKEFDEKFDLEAKI